MKMHFLCRIGLLVLVLGVISCSSGPSEKEVESVIMAAVEALDLTPEAFDQSAAEQFRYRNTVTFSTQNEEATVKNDYTLVLDRGKGMLDMEIVCNFDGYQAPATGSTYYGTVVIGTLGSVTAKSSSEMDMEIAFDLNLNGGKVESVAFVMDQDHIRSNTVPEMTVNGKPFIWGKERRLFNTMMRNFSPVRLQ